METGFTLDFGQSRTARIIRPQTEADLPSAFAFLELPRPSPVVVLIGGASRLSPSDQQLVRSLFSQVLSPLAQSLGAIVIDGGTDVGIMQMMGCARHAQQATFPLLGIAPVGCVALPNQPLLNDDMVYLEPHHTQFLLIPGDKWGAEAAWIARVASLLAQKQPSVTVLINGGEVSWLDAQENVDEGRPLITIAGSGRTADALAKALDGNVTDARAQRIIASGLVQAIELEQGDRLTQVIHQILATPIYSDPLETP
ncbi:MAG: hypothetical protein AAFY26_19930 [Cyanobacteria bacterium J06638_22]